MAQNASNAQFFIDNILSITPKKPDLFIFICDLYIFSEVERA